MLGECFTFAEIFTMLAKKSLLTLSIIFCIVWNVNAYLDPGSGSYVVQMIIAGFLGGFYALKLYWNKIINFIRGNSDSTKTDDDLENE
jgi:hypothetical protein